MKQAQTELAIGTNGKGFTDITDDLKDWVSDQGMKTGLLTLFICHTSASLVIQENADPDVLHDLESFFAGLVSEGYAWRHASEGPDDMPAHIRSALTQTSLSIPVTDGRMVLGTWQGIYLYEHRRYPHRRRIVLHLVGS